MGALSIVDCSTKEERSMLREFHLRNLVGFNEENFIIQTSFFLRLTPSQIEVHATTLAQHQHSFIDGIGQRRIKLCASRIQSELPSTS